MGYLDEDLGAGYPKIWLELQALAWNHPEMRERVARGGRGVARGAHRGVRAGARGVRARPSFPLEAVVALVMTFNKGIMLERMSGIDAGTRELLAWIDGWLAALRRSAT